MERFIFCFSGFVLLTIVVPILADVKPGGHICGKTNLFSYYVDYSYKVEKVKVPPGIVLTIPATSFSTVEFTNTFSQYTSDGSTTFYGFSTLTGGKEFYYSITYPPNEQNMGTCSTLVNIEDLSVVLTGYRRVAIATTSEGVCEPGPPSGANFIGSPVHIDNDIFKYDFAVYTKERRLIAHLCFSVGNVIYVGVDYETFSLTNN